jgi:microcystin-dependent protein
MADPFLGEIRMFAGPYAPLGWAFCAGQTMNIADNDALFSLIGTTYGGDGATTFDLPDLRGRVPIHQNPNGNYPLGQIAGSETITLTTDQIPAHSHPFVVSQTTATQTSPQGNMIAQPADPNAKLYVLEYTPNPAFAMLPNAMSKAGLSEPHSNLQPYVCVSFIIALAGIFPAQP